VCGGIRTEKGPKMNNWIVPTARKKFPLERRKKKKKRENGLVAKDEKRGKEKKKPLACRKRVKTRTTIQAGSLLCRGEKGRDITHPPG